MQNFLDCVRSRERTVNPEVMPFHTTVHAANICMWPKRSLVRPCQGGVRNDEEANAFAREPCEPYIY
jgi:hypothetical protein